MVITVGALIEPGIATLLAVALQADDFPGALGLLGNDMVTCIPRFKVQLGMRGKPKLPQQSVLVAVTNS